MTAQTGAEFGEHFHFQSLGGLLQPGNLALTFAQIGAGKAGAVLEGGDLAVIARHFAEVGAGDFQKIAEDVVVARP